MARTFTDTDWSSLGNRGLCRETGADLGWMALHDLSVQAHEHCAEFCKLSFDEWRQLVSAAATGLPITIKHKHLRRTYSGIDTETTEATYIVTQLLSLSGHTTANLYVRTWGFSYPLALSDIVAVSVPQAIYSFGKGQ